MQQAESVDGDGVPEALPVAFQHRTGHDLDRAVHQLVDRLARGHGTQQLFRAREGARVHRDGHGPRAGGGQAGTGGLGHGSVLPVADGDGETRPGQCGGDLQTDAPRPAGDHHRHSDLRRRRTSEVCRLPRGENGRQGGPAVKVRGPLLWARNETYATFPGMEGGCTSADSLGEVGPGDFRRLVEVTAH